MFKINRQIVELVKAKIGPIKAMAMEVGLLHKTCCLSKVDFADEFIIGERPIQIRTNILVLTKTFMIH